MSTQVCKKCGVEKSVSEFAKGGKRQLANGETKQYYKTVCKQCTNKGRVRVDNIEPKVCNTCGVAKPLSEYALEKQSAGMRYRAQCKKCKYEKRLKHRAENPEVLERERERNRWRYANVEGVAEKSREYSSRYREEHRDRLNAEQRERWANDPEYAERQRQYQRDLWANNPEHREKQKKNNRAYYEENKEKIAEYKKQYQLENKDKIRERQQKYYYDNPEHMKKLRKAQYDKHKEKLVKDQRRIRKERRQYLEEYLGGKCVRCGVTEKLEFDHITPVNKSYSIGANITSFSLEELILEADKCQLLCRPCHIQKSKENGDYVVGRELPPEIKENRLGK